VRRSQKNPEKIIIAGEIKVKPIFFDSLGAKCMSVLIKTPDIRLLVDPGAAGMQKRTIKERRKMVLKNGEYMADGTLD